MTKQTGYLVLNTGDVLEGEFLGKPIEQEGEMVFNTAMTGYQEVLTDPSYAGQIVTLTYPLVGNYGCNDMTKESHYPALAGLIIGTACEQPDHYQSNYSVKDMIMKYDIPTLQGVDTRSLTRIIRQHGEVYGKITTNPTDKPTICKVNPNLVKRVSVSSIQQYKAIGSASFSQATHVVVIDFGYKHSITQALIELGCEVTVVPYDASFHAIKRLDPDGVIVSNGPGDPSHLQDHLPILKQIAQTYPTLGICLGHQLIALAFGGKTNRLPYGHRGSNHPVKDLLTGKVYITSQNHGYVVDDASIDSTDWSISHRNVNDQSVEGLKHKHLDVTTVQFHPEANPGPKDTQEIFEHFVERLSKKEVKQHA
ncbi:carbamoyl phosphate synthase small subunit [Paraliobacillus salinarum]|uniref:carbamoyl phosphate synthase small subunit n=1 Tax=Paraliobacillus salinarum TaxID=1158996 RepID=UPI0015F3E21F|nr:carbamoyl phosphate synthase small subunit [Paraliobacillus salinarum]